MPTYEYRCDACGHAFERFQSITADPVKKCPECGKNKVKRLISIGAGMIFKGSGFYITDYRDKSYAERAKADAGGGGGGEAKPAEGGGAAAAPAASFDAPAARQSAAPKSDAPKSDAPAAGKSDSKPKGGDASGRKRK